MVLKKMIQEDRSKVHLATHMRCEKAINSDPCSFLREINAVQEMV
jgi:hypothetical protein